MKEENKEDEIPQINYGKKKKSIKKNAHSHSTINKKLI